MYADRLKYFVKVIGKKAIGHVVWIETILIDVQLSLSAHKLTQRRNARQMQLT